MRIPDDIQALRVENLGIARMQTAEMYPQRDFYDMSVVSEGKEERIFYSWPELKGHKFCNEYFKKQDLARNEIVKNTENDVNSIKTAYEEEVGKPFEEEEEENIILEGSGFERELF